LFDLVVIHVSYGVTVYMSNFCRLLSLFSDSYRTEESDDIHAALALMYGYAARYAPSTVIEARIDALLVWFFSYICMTF